MNTPKPSRFMFLLAGVATALGGNRASGQVAPGSPAFHWPETALEMPAADKLPTSALEPFLDELKPRDVPDLKIGEFRFAPMDGPRPCLAATVDASGREMYFSVAVVCPGGPTGSFQLTMLPSAPPHSLGAELVDLDGDGEFEVVTRELAGQYEGVRTLPIFWYSVFRVAGGVPRDVSASHKMFYGQRLLPELDFISRLIESANPLPLARMAVESLAEARFLRAKYERRIIGVSAAGFGDAVEWSHSDDPDVQLLAVDTFRDMASPEAILELKKLEKAKDYVVSQAATNAVDAKTQAPR